MHKLLTRQLRAAARKDGEGIDVDALLAIIDQTYDEFDRERRLNDRAATLMEEELKTANAQAQREHDAVLAAILNNASDGMLVVRDGGLIDLANAAAEKQFAAAPGALIGQPIGKLLGAVAQAISRGERPPEGAPETAGTALDGCSFPVEYSFATLDMWGGRRLLWIVRDISERKRTQRDLQESRLRFQDFAEASSDCFWEMNETLGKIDVTAALKSELSVRLPSLLLPGPDGKASSGISQESWRALRRSLAARQQFRLRLDVPREDGTMFNVSLSGKPVFDLDGRFRGYRGSGRDITREVIAREAAQRAERRLIEAIDAAPSAIALVDAHLNLVGGNSALRMMAPVGAEHIAPMPGQPFSAFLENALQGSSVKEVGVGSSEFLRTVAATGQMREIALGQSWYLVAARTLSDGGMVLTFTDVSALKNRERELGEAKFAAESANRLKSQFLATMSHELRTPLNAILGFSEVIRDGIFGQNEGAWQKYVEYANSIFTSGKHLLSLISEILDLSKIEAGTYVLDIVTLDLRSVIESALAIIAPAAKKANVETRCLMPPEPLLVAADARSIRQIALNLLANAVKFTPPGGKVTVEVRADGPTSEFSVSDTGIGIAQEDVGTVFELFRQVDASISRRHEGTGLGLAISKRLAEMHGGTIALESELAVGTTVRVRLPLIASRGRKIEAAA